MSIFSKTTIIPGFSKSFSKFVKKEGKKAIEAKKRYLTLWENHLEINKVNILEAAAKLKNPKNTVILGAGLCTDIPLPELAEMSNVTLMDFDKRAITLAKKEIKSNYPNLAERIHLKIGDVSGIIPLLIYKTEEAIAWNTCIPDIFKEVSHYHRKATGLYKTIDIESNSADLVISSLVLSILSHPTEYIVRKIPISLMEKSSRNGFQHFTYLKHG